MAHKYGHAIHLAVPFFYLKSHALLMECGDPRGVWGRSFLPIRPELLQAIRKKQLSVFTCHLPMDTSRPISTGVAIMEALEAQAMQPFWREGNGHVGMICRVKETDTPCLIDRLTSIFAIACVDFEGNSERRFSALPSFPAAGMWSTECVKRKRWAPMRNLM